MKILLFTLLSLHLYSASFNTTKFNISFNAYLVTDLDDNDHAIKRQINQSQDPMLNLKATGQRSSLSHSYTYKVTKVEKASYYYMKNAKLSDYQMLDVSNN